MKMERRRQLNGNDNKRILRRAIIIIASASVKNPCHVRLFYASRAKRNPRQNG
jgi:hypothetical protein